MTPSTLRDCLFVALLLAAGMAWACELDWAMKLTKPYEPAQVDCKILHESNGNTKLDCQPINKKERSQT